MPPTLSAPLLEGENQARAGLSPAAVLRLQRMVGNATVQRLISTSAGRDGGRLQRAPLTAADKAKNLSSARYAGDPKLEAAYDNSPALGRPANGDHVAKIQQGLVDAGFKMPVSFKSGGPDGIFGKETSDTVEAFQGSHGLKDDGWIGRNTMGKLDELAGGEGPKPKPPEGLPEIEASEEEIGKRVAQGMDRANTGHSPTSGIWYDYNYFAEHKKDPMRYSWQDDWRSGLASPAHFDKVGWMDWRLKPGVSASAGIKAWLKGLTIAECLSAIVAVEIDAMRAAIGDAAFDAQYGSPGAPVPGQKLLQIHPGVKDTPLEGKIKASEAATGDPGPIGKRNLKLGDWVYFYNHPKYLLKHPGGAWQGENAVYTGDNAAGQQLFTGLGAGGKTEEAMLASMVGAYDSERDGADYVELLQRFVAHAPEVKNPNRKFLDHDTPYTKALYEKYKADIPAIYREDSGEFTNTTTRDNILNDNEYEIDARKRKGGFLPAAARRLDAGQVKAMRPVP